MPSTRFLYFLLLRTLPTSEKKQQEPLAEQGAVTPTLVLPLLPSHAHKEQTKRATSATFLNTIGPQIQSTPVKRRNQQTNDGQAKQTNKRRLKRGEAQRGDHARGRTAEKQNTGEKKRGGGNPSILCKIDKRTQQSPLSQGTPVSCHPQFLFFGL